MRKFILDTDWWTDCDDAVAVRLLCNAHRQGKVEILGIKVPSVTIPVKPGRNLAIILEIAAMNNRQKKMGYNTAEEFNKRLMGQIHDDE